MFTYYTRNERTHRLQRGASMIASYIFGFLLLAALFFFFPDLTTSKAGLSFVVLASMVLLPVAAIATLVWVLNAQILPEFTDFRISRSLAFWMIVALALVRMLFLRVSLSAK